MLTLDRRDRRGAGAAIAWLYRHGEVLARRDGTKKVHMKVDLDPADLSRFRHRNAAGQD